MNQIWRDNLRLRDEFSRQKNKRPPFDPAQLTWIPRKRHNTRWPINPPTEYSAFIARLQPFIKFELHISQIDEAICSDHDEECGLIGAAMEHHTQQIVVPTSARVSAPEVLTQLLNRRKSSHRRRTLRPSLGTITEATDEAPMSSMLPLTPASTRRLSSSPTKTSQWPAYAAKTPTKVAESPLKNFVMSVSSERFGVQIEEKQDGQAVVAPSPADRQQISSHVDQVRLSSPSRTEGSNSHTPVFNHAGHFRAPSTIGTASTISETQIFNKDGHFCAPSTIYSDSTRSATESSSTYVTGLPLFDQPISKTQAEPEYESRRRFSLENARRSDRTSDVRIIKRIRTWMAGSFMGTKRRYSDIGGISGEQQEPKRRHTLDVDAGMNPDIFGQLPTLPAHNKPPIESMEIFDEAVKRSEDHVPTPPAVPAEEEGSPSPVKASPHDQDVALSEGEEPGENAESEEIEEAAESEDDEDNVEGDSDITYLQSFIQRSKSSKGETHKDVPSAPILIKGFSKKRRSTSMSSATSETGSPQARITTTATMTTSSPRVPLGEKDANKSPSPSKKRKLKGLGVESDVPLKKKTGRLAPPDLEDSEPTNPRKKRRKGRESDTNDIFNPSMDMNQVLTQKSGPGGGGAGSRRSTRIATIPKRDPPAIPVRLPGSAAHMLADLPEVSTAGVTNAAFQRKLDKELTAETENNTRRNRGDAVPVHLALASMAERSNDGDETTIVSFELKVVRAGDGKAVRWDEILARVQGEATESASPVETEEKVEAESAVKVAEEEKEDEEDTHFPSPPQLRVVQPTPDRPGYPIGPQLSENDDDADQPSARKSAPSRSPAPVRRSSRTTAASRLPKRGTGGAAVTLSAAAAAAAVTPSAAPLLPVQTPKRRTSLLPAPSSRVSKAGVGVRSGGPAATEAARARLGMAGPGTPAPRRGGRRGGRRG